VHSLHTLQGALGKTSGRSYKAAPRQLLQVETGHDSSHAEGESGIHDPVKDVGGSVTEVRNTIVHSSGFGPDLQLSLVKWYC
jgi:hypothetical protein